MLTAALLADAQKVAAAQLAPTTFGRVARVTGMLVEAHLHGARVGDLVEIERQESADHGGVVMAEVVGLRDALALAVPLSDLRGVAVGALVHRCKAGAELLVGDGLLGRVVDSFGKPIDGGPAIVGGARVPVEGGPPALSKRTRVEKRFDTGVRAIDGMLTLGRGQRVGIFAGAGVGKTVLLRQIVAQSSADITVFALIGERGIEVHDLLAGGALSKSVVVAATSDRSPLERARGALTATAIAEHFRDRGANVLLVVDSLTRYAMALREIGLAAGEPPATKGYPPSVFAALPKLLERVAPLERGGSITGVYTVLVEGDDLADPVADSARSLLDGHIVLSRDLAARGHFPAIDVLASTSRVQRAVIDGVSQQLVQKARTVMARRREAEDLRSLGAYVAGSNPAFDEALALAGPLDGWLRQASHETVDYATGMRSLQALVGSVK